MVGLRFVKKLYIYIYMFVCLMGFGSFERRELRNGRERRRRKLKREVK